MKTLVCIIRYQIDPFQRDDFERRAEHLGRIIPRNGGHLIGYFMPHEGTNDVAWGIIALDSLSDYEAYRTRLKGDADLTREDAMAHGNRLIIREERNFVKLVDGTFNQAPEAVDKERKLACLIRYQIDPFKKEEFLRHAENLIRPVPRSGGHLVGFFVPHEGTNNVAWAMVTIESLTDYEAYRIRLKADPDAIDDAARMHDNRVILREERNFVRVVEGTFNRPPT